MMESGKKVWNTSWLKTTDLSNVSFMNHYFLIKHIDLYTGECKQDELETFRITGTENNVLLNLLKINF